MARKKPSAKTIFSIRQRYVEGYGTESLKKFFKVSNKTFDKILRGDFGRGKP